MQQEPRREPVKENVQQNMHNVMEQAREEVASSREPWYRSLHRARVLIIIYILEFVLFTLLAVREEKAGWNLDSGLEIKRDPCWRVVARVFLSTHPSVNTAVHKPDRQIR